MMGRINKNTKIGIIIMAGGLFIAGILQVKSHKDSYITEIKRSEYGEGESISEINLISDYGEELIDIEIGEREYSKEELLSFTEAFINNLPDLIKGNNKSVNEVNNDLEFAGSFDGFPFKCDYIVEEQDYLSAGGEIKKEVTDKLPVRIDIEASYMDYSFIHSMYVCLVPKDKTEKDRLIESVKNQIVSRENTTKEDAYLILPKEVDGHTVRYKKKKTNKSLVVMVFALLSGILYMSRGKIEEREKDRKIRQRLKEEYPYFAQKFSMLTGAGLSPRQIFMKMADSYIKRGKRDSLLYDQVVLTARELNNGVPEVKAYENMAARCDLREISVFISVINQNMRKGSVSLHSHIKKLSEEALLDQKSEIKKKGETAGSRLLLPMMVLLMIVFVMIMVPAFLSFSSFL